MAITFVAAGTITTSQSLLGTDGQLAVLPAGVVEDDFLIIYSHRNDNAGTFDALGGWTIPAALDYPTVGAGTDQASVVYHKFAGGAEGNATIFHSDAGLEQWTTVMLAYRGVDLDDPIDVTPISAHVLELLDKLTTNVDAFAEITTVTNNAFVLALESVTHDHIDSSANPDGYDNRIEAIGSTYAFCQMQIWDNEIATAQAETPGAPAYNSSSTGADAILTTLALRPAANGNGGVPLLGAGIM